MNETLEKRLFELAKTYKRIEKSIEETENIYKNIIGYEKTHPLGKYDDSKFIKMETDMWKYLNALYKNYLKH